MLTRRALAPAVALIALAACARAPQQASASSHIVPIAAVASDTSTRIADDLPALPRGIDTAVRPPAVVKAAYEFAARHPEVLTYVPCFCGCERMGHKGNEDCFVAKRDAAGRVTEWVAHGMVCETCLDVATQAMKMHAAGASVAEIRAAVEADYLTPGGAETPTPMPPPAGVRP
jgi:hypothetical protein